MLLFLNNNYCWAPWTATWLVFVWLYSLSGVQCHHAHAKPWLLRASWLLLRFGGLFSNCNSIKHLAPFLHLEQWNTYVLFDFTFCRFFFHLDFLIKPLQIMCNSYFRRVSCWWNAHLCANLIIYYVPGTIFSRRPLWGGLKCDRGVKHTFSKTHFIFLVSFFILFFSLAKVLDSLQITAFGSRGAKLLASLGGSPEARREPFCIEKTMLFAYVH